MTNSILMAKPGLDGHDRGAKLVSRALRDGGFEVIYTGIRQTPKQIAFAAIQEDVDVVGLSILSGAHVALTRKVAAELRALDGGDIAIVVGGTIPSTDVPKLLEAGARAVFPTGTPLGELVTGIREMLAGPPLEEVVEPVLPAAAALGGGPGPLAGVRVLDFSHFLAGPYATLILAEMGADVIKVEDPGHPDEARLMGPHFQDGQSLYFAALNRGKRSLSVPLRSPEGRQAIYDLLKSTDVVVDNYRPGVMAALGLGPEVLQKINPALVTCSLSGFGATGPYAQRVGYDYTIQALAGVMSMTGEPDGPPGKAGISYVDHSGGLAAALAVSSALYERTRTGRGRHVDLGLFDIQTSMLTYLAAWNLNREHEPRRVGGGAHPVLVPAQTFATRDGHLSLFIGNDAMWTRLVVALEDPVLADPALATNAARFDRREEVLGRLAETLGARDTEHWNTVLGSAGVPCGAVNTLGEALRDPQVAARGLVVTATHTGYGDYRCLRGPLPDLAADVAHVGAPLLGEHTEDLLTELGYDADRVAGIVGGRPLAASA